MAKDYPVITLCGSVKFKDIFMEKQRELTLQGNIVISVGFFGLPDDREVLKEDIKEMLDDIHKRKIDMADIVYIINPNGYIGSSTQSEIEYAHAHGKQVQFMCEASLC